MHGLTLGHGAVAGFVEMRHSDLASRTVLFGYANPADVGLMAAKFMRVVRSESFSEESARFRTDAQTAGLLIYAIERYGLTFDDVIDIAGVGVAALLAAVTPDCRLSGPRRNFDFRSRLGQASAEAQTIRLAEVICATKSLQAALRNDLDTILAEDIVLKAWLADHIGWLEAMRALDGHGALKKQKAACLEMLLQLEADRENVRDAIKLRDAVDVAEPDAPEADEEVDAEAEVASPYEAD